MLERIYEHAFQDMMALCQEVEFADVTASRKAGGGDARSAVAEPASAVAEPALAECKVALAPTIAVAVGDADAPAPSKELWEALRFNSNLKDDAILLSGARRIPKAIADEQVRLHQLALSTPAAVAVFQPKLLVQPGNKRSRLKVAAAFEDHLRCGGWRNSDRVPSGACQEFINVGRRSTA